ncbi:MAG TPA: cytochrome b562 [Opitutaceae bacterium]|nr:cytochrome b562 [Opitutaceae bacterium]
MKIRILLCSAALAFSVIPGLRAADGDTELQGKMQKMSSAFRPLRAQLSDATKNDDSLAKVATIKENATAALKLTPMKIADMPAADQAKALEGYKAELQKLIDTLDKLTAALKAGNNDEAVKIYADLGAIQKEGHSEYKKAPAKKQ